MEIKIGVQNTPRELVVESSLPASEVSAAVEAAVSGISNSLALTDDKGRKIVVPSSALAYVEIGAEQSRRVGFGAT